MAEGFAQYPPRTALPNLTLHKSTVREHVDAAEVATAWLSSLVQAAAVKDTEGISALLFEECWWRDFVGLSWTITSKYGPEAVTALVLGSNAFEEANVITTAPLAPQLQDMGPMTLIQFGFAFRTKYSSGRGIVRLGNDGPDSWKAWTISTQMEELSGPRVETNGVHSEPGIEEIPVLIVGAGQSGVQLAAWLQEVGIKYIVVEKAPRPGDGWRSRYASIKTHTPIYCDHFAFLKFPSNWPRFLDRDTVADWIDQYSRIMGTNMLCNAAVTSADRDASTGKYTVQITVDGREQRVFRCKHLVLATGIFPPVPIVPDLPGRASFQGQAYHTVEHTSAADMHDLAGKKIAIIGAGTSAHDIAQDLVSHGAKDVTMIQRGRIGYASTNTIETMLFPMWNTPGTDTDDADLLGGSMPLALLLTLTAGMAPMMTANDKTMIEGLEKAGMAISRGEDGISILDYQTIKTGQFYIDQGAADMIVDGRIKIRRCAEGVREFNKSGIELADGTQVDADIVIFSTGFKTMQSSIESLLGPEVVEKAASWSIDAESEIPGLARPTGVPGLWYLAGGFLMCRQFSKLLALQIAAVERGVNREHYQQ